MPIAIYHLVKMVDTRVSPSWAVGLEFMHNIRQQHEERDEDHNNPLLDHTEGPEYVCLPPPPRPVDHNKGIGTVGVEKVITHLDLQWAHHWHTPNGSQRVDNAAFKPRIVDAGQSKCLHCVNRAPIVDKSPLAV